MTSGSHILVVDDDAEIRDMVRQLFEKQGFSVDEAEDSTTLHAALGRRPADLVILDLNLGGESGLELSRELRASRDLPVIILTAAGDAIDRIVGLEVGADDYVVKPFH